MKIRLQVDAGASRDTFEHPGPAVQIGRDPSCELALEGDRSTGVSRQHARIDLAPGGATLSDTGSSNGTLLNDQPIDGPRPLRRGDRVRLGYTGATLTVLDLDLHAPAAPPPLPTSVGAGESHARPILPLVLAGGGAAALLVAVVLVVMLRKPSDPPPDTSGQTAVAQGDPLKVDPNPVKQDTLPSPVVPPKPPETVPIKEDPSEPVGRYLPPSEKTPSVLLQRRGESFPWLPLRTGEPVRTGHALMALPGYRGIVELDSGVRLTLWGNVPEFAFLAPAPAGLRTLNISSPPVLESLVALGSSTDKDKDKDAADVTLERGRVVFANTKSKEPARVRLRFLREEAWDLTLLDPNSEVLVDLWWENPAWSRQGRPPGLPPRLMMLTRGRVKFQAYGEARDLPELSGLLWSPGGAPPRPEAITAPPDHWVRKPDLKNPAVERVLGSLISWREAFDTFGVKPKAGPAAGDVLNVILPRVRDAKDWDCVEGLMFLAALDAIPYVVPFLVHDRPLPRNAAIHAVRVWLARGGDRGNDFLALLQDRLGFRGEMSALAFRLFFEVPSGEQRLPEIYQELIGLLDHEERLIRELANGHLLRLVPGAGQKIDFKPGAPPEERKKEVDKWKKLVPPGTVPAAR